MQYGNLLNEICEASAMKATAALSKFLKTPIGIDVKPIEMKQPNEIGLFLDPEELFVKLFVPITGNLSGYSFFLYPTKSALLICDQLFHKEDGETQSFTEIEKSGLTEVANIVIGNFLTAFAKSLHKKFIMHRSADFTIGSFTHIYDQIQATFPQSMRSDIIIKISFEYQHTNIKGYVVLVFEAEQINIAFKEMFEESGGA